MKQGILSVIGNTPLVELTRVLPGPGFRLYAKLEGMNPGGSMKDRAALNMITSALKSGLIDKDTTVIESSSGNMGVGLAQACCYMGLKFICVVDRKTPLQNIRLCEAYGAKVDIVTLPDPGTGEYLQARLNRVKELLSITARSYWPNQYANPDNPAAHHQTMKEICDAISDEIYGVFCATSTCGTLRGCAEYIVHRGFKTKLIAVDAIGSVIFGSPSGKRLIPGHGSAVVPPLFYSDIADEVVLVSDLDCVIGCRRLAAKEAIMCGGSSGAIITAIERFSPYIPDGSVCVAILGDRGERYLDTIYSDTWVREQFGEIFHLWGIESKRESAHTENRTHALAPLLAAQ